MKDIVVAVDVGTTKVLTIVAEVFPEEKKFNVIGYGINLSHGLTKGVVEDIEEATRAISSSIATAEHMAGVNVENVIVGIAGKHIESLISHSIISLGKTPREISEEDRLRLEQLAATKVVPVNRRVIHKIVYNYKIDDRDEIVRNPIGMVGTKLEADVHVITGSIQSINSLVQCIQKLDYNVEDIVLEPLASAKAVLTDTEKKLGCVIVDIGGGTTDIAIYKNEKLIYTSVIPVGGENYTNDLATVLGIDSKIAEKLKKEFGTYKNIEDEQIEIPLLTGDKRTVDLTEIKEIIDARTEEILEIIKKKIDNSGYGRYLQNIIVFTGGSSKIAGLKEKAEEFFKMPVRIGVPLKTEGLMKELIKPEDATGVGLLLYGIEKYFREGHVFIKKNSEKGLVDFFVEKVKDIFEKLF